MKKYRLKRELHHLFSEDSQYHNLVTSLINWDMMCITIQALEEVEEKIDVIRLDNNKRLQKSGNYWTEQEREGIEKFLNVFGSWDKMLGIILEYYTDGKDDFNFEDWLKCNKYLK